MTLEQLVGSRMRRLVRRFSPYVLSLSVGILPLACEDASRPPGVSSRDASAGRLDAGVADAYVGDTSVFTDSGLSDTSWPDDATTVSSDAHVPRESADAAPARYDIGDAGLIDAYQLQWTDAAYADSGSDAVSDTGGFHCQLGETREFYTGPEGALNVGECRAGIATCLELGGRLDYITTTPQITPTAELCDRLDNDCDGVIDNGFANIREVCDGIDNDCDGDVDESYHIGEACSVGVGECARNGIYVCAELIGSQCNAVPGDPWVEVCNGLDDDCDGVRDDGVLHTFYSDRDGDGFGNPTAIVEGCDAPFGYVENNLDCDDYDSELHPRAAELCDGIDNNCNDLIDEGYDNLGQPCSDGLGECQRDGVYICAANKLETVCNVVRGDSQPELCDDLDQDCNGDPLNGYNAGNPCAVGDGQCRAEGLFQCTEDHLGTVCDAIAGQPLEEICGNGIDENCDGIDERCLLAKIAFHSTRNGVGEIYVMNEDGSDQVNLTNHPSHEAYPNWSPDGTKIAFTNGGDEDIIVVDYPDGGNRTNLTNLPGRDLHPNWSPDGTKIAFSSTRFGGWNVCIMDNTGENVQLLTNGMYPTWSPDGQWIAYQRGEALRITSTDFLNNDRELVEDGMEPAWSPDGRYIAFRRQEDILIVEPNGNNTRPVIQHPALDWHPSWSPDSRKLVFASERNGGREVYVVDIFNGEAPLQLTNTPGYDEDPAWSRH